MLEAYDSKVILLYLPPHSSHILQPLDVGVFATLKAHYRAEVADLYIYDNSQPVKKQEFLKYYIWARNKCFKPSRLQSGWKGAGIFPWRPSKVFKSSQQKDMKAKAQVTPPKKQNPRNQGDEWETPKDHKSVHTMFVRLQERELPSRDTRTVFAKCQKAVALQTFAIAQYTSEIAGLKEQIEALLPKTRKR